MNILTVLLQTTGGAAAAPQGSSASMWIMLLLIFVVMWFFMIRPQRKQQKELEKFRSGLKKGDKVVTVGGIHGVIDEVKDNESTVLLRVDGEVKLRVEKSSLVSEYTAPQQR